MQRSACSKRLIYIKREKESLVNLFEAAYIRELNVSITGGTIGYEMCYEADYIFLVDGAPLSAAHLAYQDKLARLRQVEPAVFCNFPVGCTTGGPRCGKLQPRLFMTNGRAFRHCITPLQTPRTVDAKEEATVTLISPIKSCTINRTLHSKRWIRDDLVFFVEINLYIFDLDSRGFKKKRKILIIFFPLYIENNNFIVRFVKN